MKYFLLTAILFFFGVFLLVRKSLLIGWWQKTFFRRLMFLQSEDSGEKFFARPASDRICRQALCRRGGEEALQKFISGQKKPLLSLLKKNGLQKEAAVLSACKSPEKAISLFSAFLKKNPNDTEAKIYLAELYFLTGEKEKGLKLLENTSSVVRNRYLYAVKNYLLAQDALNWGGLQEASEYGAAAVAGFEKEHAFYEAARVQILLGTIYRVAAMSDVSEIMLRAAQKIYEKINCPEGVADTCGNLGMLMVMQKRFEEAENYFDQAKRINRELGRKTAEAEIINQSALLRLLEGKAGEAHKIAEKALKLHKKQKNSRGEAFSLDIVGYVFLHKKKYKDLIKTAKKAEKLYDSLNDPSSRLNSLYLLASAYFETEDMEKAEQILRTITREAKDNPVNFHIANAYSMLGLIFLQKGELLRAKGLFMQSLQLEQKHDRLNAAAADFANIALVEQKRGQTETAKKNLETAVSFAKACGDAELEQLLQKELIKFTPDKS